MHRVYVVCDAPPGCTLRCAQFSSVVLSVMQNSLSEERWGRSSLWRFNEGRTSSCRMNRGLAELSWAEQVSLYPFHQAGCGRVKW